MKSWLAKLARSRIHFLRLSFDVARENRSVDGAMAPAKVWGGNYFRARVVQERGGNKAKGGKEWRKRK